MLRKWDIEDDELNKKCIEEVITRIEDIEDPEKVGVVAAQDLIDIVMENYAPHIYNRAVDEVQKVINEKNQDADYAIYSLKQST